MTKFQPDQSLYPFKSNWVDLGSGSRVHYVDEGGGPVLLLLHGNPSWSFLYRNIVTQLSGQFRCIAPDLPGFGLSEATEGFSFTAREQAQVIVEFIDHLDLQGVGVMMQDWGGPTGLYAAQMRTDRIDRLIIGNTFGWPLSDTGVRLFSAIMGGALGRFSARSFNGVVRFFFSRGVKRKLSAQEWAMYFAPFQSRDSRHPTHIFPKQLIAAKPFLQGIENGLPAIKDKPALILWGDSDFAFKQNERNRFKEAFPNHRDLELPGAGHFIQEDAPDAISAAIADWYGQPIVEP